MFFLRIPTPHRPSLLLATVTALLALLQFAPAQTPAESSSTGKADELYDNVTPAAFAGREDVRQAIDPENFDADLISAAIFHRTNAVRMEQGLKQLEYSAQAAKAARQHSKAMARGDYLSHGTPNRKMNLSPYERLQKQGLTPQFSAENIAFEFLLRYQSGKPFFTRQVKGETVFSYEPEGKPLQAHSYASFAHDIVEQWMKSAPHRKNLLSTEPTDLGVGAALSPRKGAFDQIYSVQDFLAPMSLDR